MKRLALALEHALQRLLERTSLGLNRWRAVPDKSALRGRRCHCPPGLPRHFLHSEGVREGCDFVVDQGTNVSPAGRRPAPLEGVRRVAGQLAAGEVIHVKADLLERFVRTVLPAIRQPFVLVTGDSDCAPVRACSSLLEDARLLHWFAQNCDREADHPRLTRLPVGLDNPRYTLLFKRLGHLLTMLLGRTPWDPTLTYNDMGDQQLLHALRPAEGPADRPLRVLCTFHLNSKLLPHPESIPERRDAWRILRENPSCYFPARRLSQAACWAAHGDFAFEVSPRGNGLDCFRTWEALILGTIPIVRTSPLDRLYVQEGLPVVRVESYEEICPANLARWRAELAPRFTPALLDRLTCEHWLTRIRAVRP